MYGNIKAYILYTGFQRILEEKDIDPSIPRGRLGVHDEYLYAIHAKDMMTEPQPFFSVVFSLSSHSPYDEPMDQVIDWGGNENPFVNSAYYTDRSLGQYFDKVRKEPWYKNTLFIIVADHSHNSYRNWPLESFEYHKIPFLLYGDVIKDEFRGKKIDRISSNTDITTTLLKQLGYDASAFNWSLDLFNPYSSQIAFFEMNDGVGFKSLDGEFGYNVSTKYYYFKKFTHPEDTVSQNRLLRQGRSYIEVLFQDFLDK